MKLLLKATAIYNRVMDSLVAVAGALVIAMVVITSYGTFMRYALHRPQVWTLESVEYMLVWFVFLVAAWILRQERHVTIDIVVRQLNPRTQALLNIIISILGAILCSLLVVYGTQLIWDHFQRGLRMDTMLRPPSAPFRAIIPIGSFVLFIQFLRRTYGYIEQWKGKALPGKQTRDIE